MKKSNTTYLTLPSGIRMVHRTVASPVSYIGIMVGTGTRDEQVRCNGIAHYIEHCVFKGTKTRNAKQIIDRIEGVGGEINAYTTKEETTFYIAIENRYIKRAIELLTDMLFNPAFPKEETDKELQVIFDEIDSYEDSPSELIYDDFEALLFANHPLQNPILGTRKSLRNISLRNVREFMQLHYTADRIVFFAQSAVSATRIFNLATPYLSSIPYNSNAPLHEQPREVTSQIVSFHKHTHQTHIMLGARAYPIGHDKQICFYLLNNILGGGSLNSRLNLCLREQHGLVYTIESTYTPLSDTGYFSVYLASEPQHTDQCIDLVMKELQALKKQALSSAELHRSIRQLHGQMAISAENRENEALAMAKLMLYHNEAPLWQHTFKQIEQLTAAQLQDVANEIFNFDKICMLQYI